MSVTVGRWYVGSMYCDAATLYAICEQAEQELFQGRANFVVDPRFFVAVRDILRVCELWKNEARLSWWQRLRRYFTRQQSKEQSTVDCIESAKHAAIVEALGNEPLLARGHFDANGEWCGKIVADAQSLQDIASGDIRRAEQAGKAKPNLDRLRDLQPWQRCYCCWWPIGECPHCPPEKSGADKLRDRSNLLPSSVCECNVRAGQGG